MKLKKIKFWLSVFELQLLNLPLICFRKKRWLRYVKNLKQLIREQETKGEPEENIIKMLLNQVEEWLYPERPLPKKEWYFLGKLSLLFD